MIGTIKEVTTLIAAEAQDEKDASDFGSDQRPVLACPRQPIDRKPAPRFGEQLVDVSLAVSQENDSATPQLLGHVAALPQADPPTEAPMNPRESRNRRYDHSTIAE